MADLDATASAKALDGMAHQLACEFRAPVALIDPNTGRLAFRHGASQESFPKFAPGLIASTSAQGRATLWQGDETGRVVWLLVPIQSSRGDYVAAAGFRSENAGPLSPATPDGWGPSCPEPALRAWGQAVSDQHRPPGRVVGPASNIGLPETLPAGSALTATTLIGSASQSRTGQDGSERLLIARLTRRLRISDPPERFQQLATNALRAAMGVKAVAWVPTEHSGHVIVNGEVGKLKGHGFRSLIPVTPPKDGIHLANEPNHLADPEVRSLICVASDSQSSMGWLLAINPTDGRDFVASDAELLQPIASLIATQQINSLVYADLKELLFGVIRALTAAIDAKDPYTSGHSERVARIAVRLGEELGMSANQRGDLYLMGLLHDVGKIGVDDAVLKKAGPLTPEEYRQIQSHVEIGVHILADLKKLNHLLPGVRHHHESLDGTGYPCGLLNEAIPLEARILAVADSYDAMSSTRPYRRRLTPSQIDEILHKGAGVQWDPKIIDALFACRMDLEMIRQKGLGESLQLAVSETLGRS